MNVSHLKIFSSVVFVKTTRRLSKLEDRSKCMVFIGYEVGSKAYRCLDPTTLKIHISRDVIFVEPKSCEFSEQDKLRKFSSCPSNILHVTGLEEGEREPVEGPRDQSAINEPRERELSQSKDSAEEEIVRYRSIQSIYDETNLLCSEFTLNLAKEPSFYSLSAKQEVWRDLMNSIWGYF